MIDGLKFTDKRARIADVLARNEVFGWDPLTAREVGDLCGQRNSSDWAHAALREMARHGLVEMVGTAFDNARTWRLTQAGTHWRSAFEAVQIRALEGRA